MAVSCSTNDDVPQPEQTADGTTTVRGTTAYTPATRTVFGPAALGEDGFTIPLTWNTVETTEHIDVVGLLTDGGLAGYSASFTGKADSRSTDGKSMEFTGTPPKDADKYAYVYPSGKYTEDVTVEFHNLTATQTQTDNDNLNHLPDYNWMYSEKVAEGEDFTLNQLGAILRFDLAFPTAVTGGTITLSSDKESCLDKVGISYTREKAVTSDFSSGSKTFTSQSLKIENIASATTSITAYMMVATASDFAGLKEATLTLKAEMTPDDKDEPSVIYTKVLGKTHDEANWEAGKTYNFAVEAKDFTANPIWAASNIYWDDVNKRLTFDLPDATTTHPYRQGVLFKWGSLVGISPAQYSGSNNWSGNVPVYVPTYNSSTSTADWDSTTASDYVNGIPYEDATTGLTTGETATSLDDTKWAEYKGDICRFLGATNTALAGYRMPRAEEFGAKTDWTQSGTGGDYAASATANGQYSLPASSRIATWTATGAIIPAAGRRNTDGTLEYVGSNARYWSSSISKEYYGFNLFFSNATTDVDPSVDGDRQFAHSIRCVKN
jgi:uncharacterized protein (TIGR02145 family)